MKEIKFLFVIIVSMQLIHVDSKELLRCELAKALIKNDFKRSFLSNWVCMIEHESNRQLNVVNKKPGRKLSYGLFQINENDCGRKGAICPSACTKFIDNNISDDAVCAQTIQNRYGFKYWSGWVNSCKIDNLPNLQILCNI